MFGIANQMLAVIALAIVSVWLVNEGRAKYLWTTAGAMLVVMTTTGTAARQMLGGQIDGIITRYHGGNLSFVLFVQPALILAMLICTAIVIFSATIRIFAVLNGVRPKQAFEVVPR